MSKFAMNVVIHIFCVYIRFQFSWINVCKCNCWLLGRWMFVETAKQFSKAVCHRHSQQCRRVPAVPHHHRHSVLSVFDIKYSREYEWHLILILLWIFLWIKMSFLFYPIGHLWSVCSNVSSICPGWCGSVDWVPAHVSSIKKLSCQVFFILLICRSSFYILDSRFLKTEV